MSLMSWSRRVAPALAVLGTAAAGIGVASASILASPGDVCAVRTVAGQEPWVYTTPARTDLKYILSPGDGFRIVAYGTANTYYGHGNGKGDGYIDRSFIRQESCG
ncbi:hypothetical protein [Patulibacter sp. SYSU D01012]|uniref:hypothetical protein n=1 Tax=Patulibacter sp. SYSU D01012 TaxID=2817381 RepID=UPI001B3165DA|nr:hypothetical protein [Patulibacter sp. SYSU D01012]